MRYKSLKPPPSESASRRSDRLAGVRFWVYQLVLLVGGLYHLTIAVYGWHRPGFHASFYLVVGLAFLAIAIIQHRLGRVYRSLERFAHAFALLVFFYQFVRHLAPDDLAGNPGLLTETLIWIPVIYTLTSLVYSTRRALALSLAIFAGTLLIGLSRLLQGWLQNAAYPPTLAMLDFYTASLIMILLLYLVTRSYDDLIATRRYAETQSRARRATEASLEVAHQTLKEKLAELERLNLQLEKASALKNQFLAVMSHELRTPLQAVLGFSELLREQVFGPLNERQQQYVEDIGASGRHLLELVDDILDVSTIEAGELRLYLERLEPRTVIEETLHLVRERLEHKNMRLDVVCETTNPLTADRRRLKQALLNYLGNAIKFTPEGGRVTLRVQDEGPGIRFEVTDSGSGIAKADLPKLFQPFTQLDSSYSRRFEGVGLGLALTKRLIELHGGQVSVTSQPGKGSCFGFYLPPQAQTSAPEATPPSKVET